jgi:hypothetical protein
LCSAIECCNRNQPGKVFIFILYRKDPTPKTSLEYWIEKMLRNKRKITKNRTTV